MQKCKIIDYSLTVLKKYLKLAKANMNSEKPLNEKNEDVLIKVRWPPLDE